ncbi:MAG: cation transporter [Clostridia bacterium]|nr:cation transporter [Clostridia bacterium]
MKKSYEIQDLDCAHCAAKMEEAILKIDGVKSATVSFIMQKFTLEADDDKFDGVLKQAIKACKKIEPDAEIIL